MSESKTIELDFGWRANLQQQGPWLRAKLHPCVDNPSPGHGLIERLWSEVCDWGVHDLVVEMQDVSFLPSSLMGELVRLHKRIATHQGRLRLCGLRRECKEALHACRLDRVLPIYSSIEDATG